MSFELHIRTGNAAFEDNAPAEVARILRRIAERLDIYNGDTMHQTVRDVNGNDCGLWRMDDE